MNRRPDIFLIGFGIVMAGGLGTLGYLGYQSFSQFSDLSTQYEEQAAELQRLQTLPLYPEQANLAKLAEQREASSEAVQSLHKQLVPMSLPLEPITPEQFQDKLRAEVSGIGEKAKTLGVKLPADFYLGFKQYQNTPPKSDAAAVLDRQLRAIELAVNTMLDNKVDAITNVDRTPLPEEGDARPLPQATGSPAKQATSKAAAAKSPLFAKFPFEVQFVSDQTRFRRVVNDLSRNPKQFFVIRPLSIQNSLDKALPKMDPNSAQAQAAANEAGAVATDSHGKTQPQNLRYIVGTERLNVALRLETVVFANTLPK